jgi:hypothetical protein
MRTLARFIRQHKDRILTDWLEMAARLPSAHDLPLPAIRNHVPEILDSIADAVDRHDPAALELRGLPNLHAAIRLREGYDLRQVIAEYRTLRRVIMKLYSELGDIGEDMRPKMLPVRDLHSALDEAITDAVDQYAVDKDRAREMFIGMLGHDLREPLHTITFTSELMRDRAPDERTRRDAARISESAERMETMIRDLLDFARGRLGTGLPIVPAPIDAQALACDTVTWIKLGHPERQIQCETDSAAGRFNVEWDGDRIAQAISNLVANAIAHGSDPIVIQLVDRADLVEIEVRNRGEIPPAVMPRLFEPFSPPAIDRRHLAATPRDGERRRGHLGLGLYIVKEICTAHGGKVQAESRDGEAIFRMVLPRRSQRAHVDAA